jgi:hypothetical protein
MWSVVFVPFISEPRLITYRYFENKRHFLDFDFNFKKCANSFFDPDLDLPKMSWISNTAN